MRIKKGVRSGIPLLGMDVRWYYIHSQKKKDHSYIMKNEHFHEYYEIVFQFSSIPTVGTVSGREYAANCPMIWFRAPYVLHSIRTEGEYVRTMVAFQPQILNEYKNVLNLGNLRERQACMIPCTEADLERLDQLLMRMQEIWRRGDSEEAWICLLGTLLYEVSNMVTEENSAAAEMPSYMHEIIRCIAENPGDDLSSAVLAKKFFVGRTKLTQDFSAALGIPMHKYVTAIRLTQAKRWLSEGVPIDVIAARCGFSQESSFIYMFRRETGMTPGEWRREQERQMRGD